MWVILGVLIIHIYLKKTGKTFAETASDVKDAITGLTEKTNNGK